MIRYLEVASLLIPLALSAVIALPAVAFRQNKNGLPSEYCVVGQPFIATETFDYDPMGNTSESAKRKNSGDHRKFQTRCFESGRASVLHEQRHCALAAQSGESSTPAHMRWVEDSDD